MYGLDKDTDLSFLSEKELHQVCVGEAQIILKFDGDIEVSLECTFEHVPKHGQVFWGDSSKPTSSNSLMTLLGFSVKRVGNIGEGGIELFFANGDRVRIHDSNKDSESYQITSPEGMIIV
jgi:hypothetical protein